MIVMGIPVLLLLDNILSVLKKDLLLAQQVDEYGRMLTYHDTYSYYSVTRNLCYLWMKFEVDMIHFDWYEHNCNIFETRILSNGAADTHYVSLEEEQKMRKNYY